jgi:hypothetical protein
MKFYVLSNPDFEDSDAITEFVSATGARRGDAPRCRVCGGPTGALPLLPPMRFELEVWDGRFGDVAFGPTKRLLVSARFRNAFLHEGLIGFPEFELAEIVNISARIKIKGAIPEYFAVYPMQSRAAVDRAASGIDGDPPSCEECRIGGVDRVRRVVIEPETWSGEDVFIARGLPGTIITSQRFKEFCDRHVFSNCVLTEASHYHFDSLPWEHAASSNGG